MVMVNYLCTHRQQESGHGKTINTNFIAKEGRDLASL